jgi:hypothetical protein
VSRNTQERILRITFNRIKMGLVVGALAAFAGCGQDAPPGPTFIAYAKNFQGFEKWPSETFDDPDPGGATHAPGPYTIYLNQQPPPNATEFPLGTIILKKTSVDGKLLAQVKRGGGYNAAGAKNWEYYEITETNGVVSIRWAATFPPAGEAYGGDPSGCNGCHINMNGAGPKNDYVIVPGLAFKGITMDAGVNLDAGVADARTDGGAATETDAGVDTGTETGAGDAEHE